MLTDRTATILCYDYSRVILEACIIGGLRKGAGHRISVAHRLLHSRSESVRRDIVDAILQQYI